MVMGEEGTEIGVGRHDHSVVAPSGLQYDGIGGSSESEVAGVRRVVSSGSEDLGDSRREVLVNEESVARR